MLVLDSLDWNIQCAQEDELNTTSELLANYLQMYFK